jgi:hypothetical protein
VDDRLLDLFLNLDRRDRRAEQLRQRFLNLSDGDDGLGVPVLALARLVDQGGRAPLEVAVELDAVGRLEVAVAPLVGALNRALLLALEDGLILRGRVFLRLA